MEKYIAAVKATDKTVFHDPVLLPFKELEIVLRGIKCDNNAFVYAVNSPFAWSPYSKAVEKVRRALANIARIDPIEDKESLDEIPEILGAVFDSRIIQAVLVNKLVKNAIKATSKEFQNEVTAFIRTGPVTPGGFIQNYSLDLIYKDEILTTSIVISPVNNFKHYFEIVNNPGHQLPIAGLVSMLETMIAAKEEHMKNAVDKT